MSVIPSEQPTQFGPGSDIDMIPSYGGPTENQQTSTSHGGTLSVHTAPTEQMNKNPETDTESIRNKGKCD